MKNTEGMGQLSVSHEGDVVVLSLAYENEPTVDAFFLPPQVAIEVAESLMAHAADCEQEDAR